MEQQMDRLRKNLAEMNNQLVMNALAIKKIEMNIDKLFVIGHIVCYLMVAVLIMLVVILCVK